MYELFNRHSDCSSHIVDSGIGGVIGDVMSIEAMKQALEAFELVMETDGKDIEFWTVNGGSFEALECSNAMRRLRQAIEQAETQEPVAYMDAVFTETVWVPPARKFWLKEHEDKAWCAFHAKHMDDIPLYTRED